MKKIFLLYAILIFAKKAPKMLSELLKLKGEGTGLKGLSIKDKMGEAALVGDKVKKGMTTLEGRTKGTLGGAAAGFLGTKGGLKAKLAGAGKGAITGGKKGAKVAKETGSSKGTFAGQYKDISPIARGGQPSFWNRAKGNVQDFIDERINKHGYGESTKANMENYGKHEAKLRAMYGNKIANGILKNLGPVDFNDPTAVSARIKHLKDNYTDVYRSDALPSGSGINLDSADSRYVAENLLSERKKIFDKIGTYQNRIEELQQNINPATAQAINSISSSQNQMNSIDENISNLDMNIAAAKNLAANATSPEIKASIETRISELRNQKANLQIEKTRVQQQIDSYQAQISNDTSYSEIQAQISSIMNDRQSAFEAAYDAGLFGRYDGTNGTLNLGIDSINVNRDDINTLLLKINDGKTVAGNEKELNRIKQQIEESGKPLPPAKDDK